MLTISIDDGSTNTKVAWFEGGQMRSITVPVSFRKGWKSAALLGEKPVANYLIDDVKYTYDLTSDRSLHTTHLDYQYSDLNLLSIHHALLQTGLAPQPVKIICTLPITAFYDKDDCQKNERNIQKKRNNLMRPVSLNKGDTFEIADVEVMPESIPAVLSTLMESNANEFSRTLVLDIGGTTLDAAVIVGKFEEVAAIYGNSEIGVSWVTDTAKVALQMAESESSYAVANELIKRRHDDEFVNQVINDLSQKQMVMQKIENRIHELGSAVAEEAKKFIKNPNRVYVVGGGASLIYPAIKEAYSTLGDRVEIMQDAQSILSRENMLYALTDDEAESLAHD
ncbi:plasmid segregation protein ParM [Shewanella sp. A25]|nr:plasmid segregation protein ParM [Shewanella shenzhenensis]